MFIVKDLNIKCFSGILQLYCSLQNTSVVFNVVYLKNKRFFNNFTHSTENIITFS